MKDNCIWFDKFGFDLDQLTPEEKDDEIKKLRWQIEKYKDVIETLRQDIHSLKREMLKSKKENKTLLRKIDSDEW